MNIRNRNRLTRRPLARALRVALLSVSGTACIAFAAAALAQDGNDTSKAAEHTQSMQAVTVTAEKKAELEKDVPISMTVVEASKMLSTGESRLDDYYAQIPGLSVNDRGSGRTTLVMRGISAGSELNPTVGVTVDDAPFGSSTTDYSISDLDPFDIDHIEVLRGPQGTLYGASSMGGLIKFVMAQPDTDTFSGRVQGDISSTDHGGVGYSARAAVNLPVVKDTFAVRVSAFKREDAGYVNDPSQGKHEVNDGDASGARVSALWKASDAFTVRASAMAQNSSTNASARVDMLQDGRTPEFGAYDHERLPGTDGADIKTRVYTLQLEGNLGWADFHSVTSYNQYRIEGPQDVSGTFRGLVKLIYGVPNAGVVIVNNNRTSKFSQEFRLSSPDDGTALSWLGGLYFTNERTTNYQELDAVDHLTGEDLGLGVMYTDQSPSRFKEKAAFGNVTYRFTDAFDVQLGGRFSSVNQSFANNYTGPLNGGDSSDAETASDNVWTYSVSPRFHVSEDLMLYGRVSTGYRAGGANALLVDDRSAFPGQYKSDSLTSYELGMKGDFLDHTLNLNAALFHIDWTDIQLSETSQDSGASYIVNAGSAKSDGAEISLNWRPLRGLTITANPAYTNAVLTAATPEGTYGRPGDRLPFSPRWSWNLGAEYRFPLSGDVEANIGGGITHVGDRMNSFTASAAAPRFTLREYTTAAVHAGIESGQWNVDLYVKNLTDERAFLSATAQNHTTGVSSYGMLLIQPRTAGISATYSF